MAEFFLQRSYKADKIELRNDPFYYLVITDASQIKRMFTIFAYQELVY